eukprot:c6497_g1_i1.p1 GENE.c6497_g1_i1~~c6497_g1_i1.p1  ORF type:complete len:206 (+),score=15.81 c6497_g1_i1:46-618(+)
MSPFNRRTLRRLARYGGVKRMHRHAYGAAQTAVQNYLKLLIEKTVDCMTSDQTRRRTTVTVQHVRNALLQMGNTCYSFAQKPSTFGADSAPSRSSPCPSVPRCCFSPSASQSSDSATSPALPCLFLSCTPTRIPHFPTTPLPPPRSLPRAPASLSSASNSPASVTIISLPNSPIDSLAYSPSSPILDNLN